MQTLVCAANRGGTAHFTSSYKLHVLRSRKMIFLVSRFQLLVLFYMDERRERFGRVSLGYLE